MQLTQLIMLNKKKIDRISQAFSATQEEKDKASQFVNEEAQKL